ncbi:hypothetical protein FO519_007168 [Halicephalobus sp. NKZ332]|nr:hypothetical protein FO519_007168 [Halicephalobus sp. NKZ332]
MNNPGNQYPPQQNLYQQNQNPQQYQRMQMRMGMPMQGQPSQGPQGPQGPQQGQRVQHYSGQYPQQQQQQQQQMQQQQMGSMQMRQRMPQQQVPQQHVQQHMQQQQQQQQHMGGPPGQAPQAHPPQQQPQQQFNVPKQEASPAVRNSKVPEDPVLMRSLNSVREPDFEQIFVKRYHDSSMEKNKIAIEPICLYPMPGSNQRNDNRNRGRTDYKKGRKNENYK